MKNTINELIGDKHEVTDSIREALEDRITSPFYGYFIISWTIVNWDYLYTAIFVSGDDIFKKTGLLKNEYLLQVILPEHYWSIMYWWNFFVLPFLITIVVFWVMPYVTNFFYRKHIRNKIVLEKIKANEIEAGIKAGTRILKAQVEQAEVKEQAEKIDPKILWKQEYEDFRKHSLFKKFSEIIDSIYTHNGNIYRHDYDEEIKQWYDFSLSQDILVYADVNKLIEKNKDVINLTDKGKEFVKFYTNDNQPLRNKLL